jgi:ribosomal-protein-alanine N-acetyltransferase
MKITRLNDNHVEAIARLEKVCFSDPWSANSIASEVYNPLSLWLVALEDEHLIGYVGSQSVLGWADMMNLAVDPDHRRLGVAEQLVLELIRQLKENQVTCLTLEVRLSNTSAISLYTKLGFCKVGRRPGYYHNPREDALILRKEWEI